LPPLRGGSSTGIISGSTGITITIASSLATKDSFRPGVPDGDKDVNRPVCSPISAGVLAEKDNLRPGVPDGDKDVNRPVCSPISAGVLAEKDNLV